jgi:hypothetical protein
MRLLSSLTRLFVAVSLSIYSFLSQKYDTIDRKRFSANRKDRKPKEVKEAKRGPGRPKKESYTDR